MAHTEHLPIYKGCYDLCLYLEQVVHNFPRYQKYTLGTDLRDGARRALRLAGVQGVRVLEPLEFKIFKYSDPLNLLGDACASLRETIFLTGSHS